MNEGDLAKKMAKVIRDRGGFAVKTHGDPRQRRGLPDIIGCYRGRFIGIEVKLPGKENTVTKLQAATLGQIRAGGGIGAMGTTVQGVRRLLDWIDRQEDT